MEKYNSTIQYYDDNAEEYAAKTISTDMSHLYDMFLKHVTPGGRILDLGCGSGRDSIAFLEKGYEVEAVDGSAAICEVASRNTRLKVRHLLFEDLDYENEFDGVWACASLLHVPKSELVDVLGKVRKALKPGGVLFACFKYGDKEEVRDGKLYSDFSEMDLRDVFNRAEVEIIKTKISRDNMADRTDISWVNFIGKKGNNIKEKFSIDKQIEHMKSQGIKFEIMSEDEAKDYLSNNTYYFKLKAYDKLYSKNAKGEYINLDFAYLRELSVIDMHLRHLILKMSVDLEHSIKVRLVDDFNRSSSDGYDVVDEFFKQYSNVEDKILKKGEYSYCGDLIYKLKSKGYALWNLIEVISFGDFIKLYRLFYEMFPDAKSGTDYTYPMYSIKSLRNAAAHNNCIINQLNRERIVNNNKRVVTFISRMENISSNQRKTCMSRQAVHDFVTMLYVVNNVIKSDGIRNSIFADLDIFLNKTAVRNKMYFEKHNELKTIYDFISKVVDNIRV